MKIKLTASVAAFALTAGLGLTGAMAQTATKADCAAGIEAVNTATSSQQGATTQQREEAEQLSQQASDAQDDGDYARCVELTQQAAQLMGG
jgi:cell division protein FtsB